MNAEQIKELTETTSRSKSNTKRIDKLEEQYELLRGMSNNIAIIAEQTKNTKEDIQELKKDVEDIKAKPTKLIDTVKSAAAGAVVTAIIGAILALIIV